MRIAIASGKGGAGKTSVAASLARVWPTRHIMADTDVEAPNLHLFLKPDMRESSTIALPIPVRIDDTCTKCFRCHDICHYGAIARFGTNLKIFPDMCHACGGCFAVCETSSLVRGEREIGQLHTGFLADGSPWLSGATRVGEVMTPPLLRQLFKRLACLEKEVASQCGAMPDVILDAPPGVSCPAVTVGSHVDAILMVVDSSPFGLHDFMLAHQAFGKLNRPLACVLNRAGMPGNASGDNRVRDYCAKHNLALLAELPFEREAAEAYSTGRLLADISAAWKERFESLARALAQCFQTAEAGGRTTCAK